MFPETTEDIEMFISDDPCTVEHFASSAPTEVANTFGARLVPTTSVLVPQSAFARSGAFLATTRGWAIICLPLSFDIGSDDALRVTWQSNVYTFKIIDVARLPIHFEILVSEHG